MRIAVTADVHLRTRQDHPERYNALGNIFEQQEIFRQVAFKHRR